MTNILVIEDSPEDYETIKRAFKKSRFANPVTHCQDGDSALDYLLQRNEFSGNGKPQNLGLILPDLNLPCTDGREVLQAIKDSKELRKTPVVVLTTSNDKIDILPEEEKEIV